MMHGNYLKLRNLQYFGGEPECRLCLKNFWTLFPTWTPKVLIFLIDSLAACRSVLIFTLQRNNCRNNVHWQQVMFANLWQQKETTNKLCHRNAKLIGDWLSIPFRLQNLFFFAHSTYTLYIISLLGLCIGHVVNWGKSVLLSIFV